MSTFTLAPAVISGSSPFFVGIMILAVVSGLGVMLRVPWPWRGLGIGLIAGAAIISLIILTGPVKH